MSLQRGKVVAGRVTHMHRRAVATACLALALNLPWAPGATRADDDDPRQRAAALFQQGVASADRGDYRAALLAFERAYALSPHPSALYNIGLALVALDQPA